MYFFIHWRFFEIMILLAYLPESVINVTCLCHEPFDIFQSVPFMVKGTVTFYS